MLSMAAIAIWLLGGVTALFFYRRAIAAVPLSTAALSSGLLLLAMIVAPFHALGWMELSGVLDRISIGAALAVQAMLALGVVLIAHRAVPPASKSKLTARSSVPALPRDVVLVGAALIGGWLLFFVNHSSSYPTGWDTRVYHLPVAVRWLQLQTLDIPTSLEWRYALPSNAELTAMVGLATGFQPAATLANFVAALVAGVAVFHFASRLTSCTASACLSSMVFLSVPMVPFQVFTGYVDLFGAAGVLGSAALLSARHQPGSRRWLQIAFLLAGLGCGLAVGTKPTLWPFAVVVCLYASAAAWRDEGDRLLHAGLFTAGLVSMSGFWFARAYVATGNPVFPLEVSLGGSVLLAGVPAAEITPVDYDMNFVRSRWEWLVSPWTEYHRASAGFGPGVGFGPLWTAFCPLALVYGMYLSWVDDRRVRLRFVIGIVLILLVIWAFGLRRMPRFALPVIALWCALAAVLFDRLREWRRSPFAALVVVAAVSSFALTAFRPVHELLGRVRSNAWTRAKVYEYPELIDHLPKDTRVLNLAGRVMTFALAGDRLTNQVVPADWSSGEVTAEWLARERIDVIAVRVPDLLESDELVGVDLEALGARRLKGTDNGVPEHRKGVWTLWTLDEVSVASYVVE